MVLYTYAGPRLHLIISLCHILFSPCSSKAFQSGQTIPTQLGLRQCGIKGILKGKQGENTS